MSSPALQAGLGGVRLGKHSPHTDGQTSAQDRHNPNCHWGTRPRPLEVEGLGPSRRRLLLCATSARAPCQACRGRGLPGTSGHPQGVQLRRAQHQHPERPGYVGRQRGWSGQSLRQLPKLPACPEVEVQLDTPHPLPPATCQAALPDGPSPARALGIGKGVSDRVRKRGQSPIQHGSGGRQTRPPPGWPNVEPRPPGARPRPLSTGAPAGWPSTHEGQAPAPPLPTRSHGVRQPQVPESQENTRAHKLGHPSRSREA